LKKFLPNRIKRCFIPDLLLVLWQQRKFKTFEI